MHDDAIHDARVRLPEVDLAWAEAGSGRPVVLLHGLNDSHRTWSRVVATLARTCRVLMPDLPGHGRSGRPDASYSLEWYARVLGDWLDALAVGDVDVVGHSFGGGIAQALLLDPRRRVRRLGLVASGGLGREVPLGLRLAGLPVVERYGQPLMAPATRLALWTGRWPFSAEERAWLSAANATPGTARAMARSARGVVGWRGQTRHLRDCVGRLQELPPTALYWGDRDPVLPVAHGLATLRLLDGATLTRYPGCGHFPHRERAASFATALAAFLEAPAARSVRLLVGAPACATALRADRERPAT